MKRKVKRFIKECPDTKIKLINELSIFSKDVEDSLAIDLHPKVLYTDTENVIDLQIVHGIITGIGKLRVSLVSLKTPA